MADLGDVLRVAPIGLLMLIGSYVAAKRRQTGAARASKEYPELAAIESAEKAAPGRA
jgi:hypothetical protein